MIYSKIKNQINNKFYNINSKIGKSILNKYLNKYLNTGVLAGGVRSNITIRTDANNPNLYDENGILMSNSGDCKVALRFPETKSDDEVQLELLNIQPVFSGSELKLSYIFPPPEIPYNLGEEPD